jgi:hypothetical protein
MAEAWIKKQQDKVASAKKSLKDRLQGGKRYVSQGLHHQADDRICTFVSKSNPENPKAYRDCVDIMSYNRYARDCKNVMQMDGLSAQEKERKCNKYRWEYLMESMPMLQVPDREEAPALWVGLDDSMVINYNPDTHQYDGPGAENYTAKRGSARRGETRASLTLARHANKPLRGSAQRGACLQCIRRRGSASRGSARRGETRASLTLARHANKPLRGSAQRGACLQCIRRRGSGRRA